MSTVYLLGAGFTRAVLGDIAPLNDDVMGRLDLKKYSELEEEYDHAYPNIEQFLTLLDLKIVRADRYEDSSADRLREIRKEVVEKIVRIFNCDEFYIDRLNQNEVLKQFVSSISSPSTILTLNYDCVLDQGLYYSERWSPYDGYGISAFPATGDPSNEDIKLFKLHGSINFREQGGNKDYPFVEINGKLFPGFFSETNKSGDQHIIIMSYIKIFGNRMMRLWDMAIDALRAADRLIIVGCSLREEDAFLRFALYHFGMKETCNNFKIEIVDKRKKDANAIKKKVERLVARPNLQTIYTYDKGLEHYLRNK